MECWRNNDKNRSGASRFRARKRAPRKLAPRLAGTAKKSHQVFHTLGVAPEEKMNLGTPTFPAKKIPVFRTSTPRGPPSVSMNPMPRLDCMRAVEGGSRTA
mmetsp:Transcript_56982/g.180307  ORF Transcript_56982/g.180307 Transcript_56982/m.180307 type:complete len:101 (-) Transcript_56982:1257-1559(-)